mgnify:CR=1 FL=1
MLVMSTANVVIRVEMKNEPFKDDEFEKILEDFIESVNIDRESEKVIVMDVDSKIHYT